MRKPHNQTGRSMIEMLATLAIMGVLSILIMWGYTSAMNKNMANNIIYDVNLRGQDIYSKYNGMRTSLPTTITNFKAKPTSGFNLSFTTYPDDDIFTITIDSVPPSVCQVILDQEWDFPYMIQINDTKYTTDNTLCTQEALATMTFVFPLNMDTSIDIEERCLSANDCDEDYCVNAVCSICKKDYLANSSNNCFYCSSTQISSSTYTSEYECDKCSNRFYTNTGRCYSCDATSSYKSTQQQCTKCAQRTYNTDSGYCRLTSCDDDTYISTIGGCISCTTGNSYTATSLENCHACSNRYYTTSGICPKCTMDTDAATYMVTTQDECDRCDERFYATNGYCYNCATSTAYKTSQEQCEKCGFARVFDESTGLCSLVEDDI